VVVVDGSDSGSSGDAIISAITTTNSGGNSV
jgi:hypothetical protein